MIKQRITPLTRLNDWIKSNVGYNNTWVGEFRCEAGGILGCVGLFIYGWIFNIKSKTWILNIK